MVSGHAHTVPPPTETGKWLATREGWVDQGIDPKRFDKFITGFKLSYLSVHQQIRWGLLSE